MRGKDEQQLDVFSYISPEQRVPQDHPLRSLRAMLLSSLLFSQSKPSLDVGQLTLQLEMPKTVEIFVS